MTSYRRLIGTYTRESGGRIPVSAEAVLFAILGSGSDPTTIAVLEIVPVEGGAWMAIVIGGAAPAGRLPRVQVTTPLL